MGSFPEWRFSVSVIWTHHYFEFFQKKFLIFFYHLKCNNQLEKNLIKLFFSMRNLRAICIHFLQVLLIKIWGHLPSAGLRAFHKTVWNVVSFYAWFILRILCHLRTGRGVSKKFLAVGFCLGSGLFGSCNSD